jgi:hypothetical protein
MGLWRRIEAAGATRLDPTDPDPSAVADGKGLRVVSPKLADALIALAVAVSAPSARSPLRTRAAKLRLQQRRSWPPWG